MSLAADTLGPAYQQGPPFTAVGATVALHRLPVYVACTLLALATNYLLGQDMAWDTQNYQFYAGFSAVNDRFAQDYFAAGPPSYFNPYAYVPFYALFRAGLSPLEISSALAIAHSVILWLTFELAVCVCPSDDRRIRMTYGVCAVAMTFVNPILVQQIGSSFADITTAELVLAGWLLLARAVRAPRVALVVCGGLLLGAATALKLTNSVHAIAGCAILIMLPRSLYARICHGLGYAIALGVGFTIIAAPWSYRLEQMFGNPLFPLLNNVFRSPEFTTAPLRHFRFIPESFVNALWRPFAMVDPVPMVQEELTAPDLRYAVLVVLIGVIFLRWLWQRLAHTSTSSAHPESAAAARLLAALGCGLAADWVLWLNASGNGRYFLPMASVAAVVIVALLFRLFAARAKIRNYCLAAIFAAQIIQLCFGANHRWDSVPWDRQWLQVEVPKKLATEPNLFLTIGTQSNSFIAPFLARGAGLVNFSGGYALGPEGASGARIEALIRRYAPHLRVLWRGPQLQADDEQRKLFRSTVDDALVRLGLRVDTSDCATIALRGLPPEAPATFLSSQPLEAISRQPHDTSYLTSCHVVPDHLDRSALIARERAVDIVFDRLEDACPALFQPHRLRTEHSGEVWRRYYVNTDLVALVSFGSVKFFDPNRGGLMVDLGPESSWANAPMQLACGRRDDHYFATVLKSKEQ
jgi:Glycosyltransferase family 87